LGDWDQEDGGWRQAQANSWDSISKIATVKWTLFKQ
jgi:hypothetical protein